ncbi:MAG TPA: hypothetical protein VJY62_02400 [Bacteroidia bacterium]|nr:hypothetical protein [Bacteroidia bacterium]
MTEVHPSEDKVLEFLIVDDETGLPIDLTLTTGILGMIIVLYHRAYKEIARYSLVSASGFKVITVLDQTGADKGKCTIELAAAGSKILSLEKIIYGEIKIKQVVSSFTGGSMDNIVSDIEISLSKDAQTKFIEVPT